MLYIANWTLVTVLLGLFVDYGDAAQWPGISGQTPFFVEHGNDIGLQAFGP